MRFAFLNGETVEASAGLKGFCRGCGQPVIAKCGTVRIRHWAHQRTEMCDNWWEPETRWHRSWKNNFPQLWQECFMPDIQNGENHIADVRTEHGLVIEFQHSHLKPKERIAREQFYQDMVWVVDGTRLIHDYPRFCKGQGQLQAASKPDIFYVYDPEKCFPSAWINSSAPVIFDFKGQESLDDPLGLREPLYCLFPVRVGRRATLARITRSAFIKAATDGGWSVRVNSIMEQLLKEKQQWQDQEKKFQLSWQQHEEQMRVLNKGRGYGKGRIF